MPDTIGKWQQITYNLQPSCSNCSMTNNELALSSHERRDQLCHMIERQQRVSVTEICQQFAVSAATARRDLEALTEQKRIRRVHGGALAVRRAPPEPPVMQRTDEQADLKSRIGRVVAEQIQDGETVFLGSGTTVYEVARHLVDRSALTVITNSLLVINTLSNAPGITLITLGGVFRRSELSFIGHITEQALTELRADTVIIGIRALDPEVGLTNDYLTETRTDRAVLHIGRRTIVAADHTKIGRISTAFVAPVDAIDILVSDTEIPQETVDAFTARGVRVLLA